MKKLIVSALVLALAAFAAPINLIAAAKAPAERGFQTGTVSGTATVDGKPLPNVRVQLRDVNSSTIVQRTNADAGGKFLFTKLAVGDYLVEIVTDDGTVIATTAATLTAAAMAATVTISTSATALAAAGAGVAGGAAAVGGGFLGIGAATAAVIGGAVVAGAVVVANNDNDASASQ